MRLYAGKDEFRDTGDAADLRLIDQSATVEDAEQRLSEFESKWDGQYPSIIQISRRNLSRLIPFFDYQLQIRKAIYATAIRIE